MNPKERPPTTAEEYLRELDAAQIASNHYGRLGALHETISKDERADHDPELLKVRANPRTLSRATDRLNGER